MRCPFRPGLLVLQLAACAVVFGSCGAGSAPSTRTVKNDGQVCLENPSMDGENVEPGNLRAVVHFDTCISSTCDEVQEKGCTAKLEGSTVRIESRAKILSKGGPCSADCGVVRATCDAPKLSKGDYTLQHGRASTDFTLTSNGPVCLPDSS